MVFFFKANCPECRILSKAKYIEAQRIEYLVEALSKSLRFLFVDFFGSSNTDHSFLGRSSKMTGGKFKRRLRLLEYNASKAAALQAASNCVDRQEDAKTADEVAVTAAEKSADGDPFAGCQREADDLAPCDTPSDDPSESQGTSPLRSGHEEKNAELRRKVKRLRDIAHHYNDEAGVRSISSIRHRRKRGSPAYCSGTFPCPTSLGTTLPKTRSSTFGMFRGVSGQAKLRKRGRNSWQKKLLQHLAPAAVCHYSIIKVLRLRHFATES